MNTEHAKIYLKGQIENYLAAKGINSKRRFSCLNPAHADAEHSMKLDRARMRVRCSVCGADYDIFDLIGMEYSIEDYANQFAKACDLYHVQTDSSTVEDAVNMLRSSMPFGARDSSRDVAAYLEEAHRRIGETNYPQKRGLSREVIERFRLGYDPEYSRDTGRETWHALIIPTGRASYTVRNIGPSRDRYRKQGTAQIFNKTALRTAQKPVFVVEGELDALSVITVGGEAVALGNVENYGHLLKLLETERPAQPLIVALDNDEEGAKAAAKLTDGLDRLKIPYYKINPYGEHKDANEALTADRENFAASIAGAEHIEDEAREAEIESYMQNCAANYFQAFLDGISKGPLKPYVPTGFQKLDSVLDGGLHEGLYIVGAGAGAGKTTFVCQIADQIAAQGSDVLIFSLESSREELMAKSISRLTAEREIRDGSSVGLAKTARDITTRARYDGYSNLERELINTAVADYRDKYAERLYIREDTGCTDTAQIRETVEKHIRFMSCKPVVIIDYIQLLTLYTDGAADRQAMDRTMLELKRMSRDLGLTVIGISDFDRDDARTFTTKEAFSESGTAEYSGDVLLALRLRGANEPGFDAEAANRAFPRAMELQVLKNRNGASGDRIVFAYYPAYNYFREAD
ncbi:MAG: DnaB-like helicase C-terminal domain-containing protein [Oscillospiraceae bacterium]|jgi:replicative DNA helicase